MKRIFLLGYMGTGKTTLGKRLAKQLGLSFIDLDHYIEQRKHKTINQLFEEEGEAKFREIERTLLQEVAAFEDVVIATGGGAPCHFDNVAVMNQAGVSIYLDTSVNRLFERLKIARSSRPLLREKNDEELRQFIGENLALRTPYYTQATLTFDANELDSYEHIEAAVCKLAEMIGES